MEIYLTKMGLNTRSRAVWNDLGNPQQLHRTISGAFPEIAGQQDLPHHERRTPRNEYNLLHRLEFDRSSGRAVLLVQSNREPQRNSFDAGYADKIETKAIHEQYSQIENGMKMRFRLQANPTKRDAATRNPDRPNQRKRVDIRGENGRIDWLKRKGDENGFRIVDVKIKNASADQASVSVPNLTSSRSGTLNFRRERNQPKVVLGSVIFDGILTVSDADRFNTALENGIGPGKAYGFGLMSVAPV